MLHKFDNMYKMSGELKSQQVKKLSFYKMTPLPTILYANWTLTKVQSSNILTAEMTFNSHAVGYRLTLHGHRVTTDMRHELHTKSVLDTITWL